MEVNFFYEPPESASRYRAPVVMFSAELPSIPRIGEEIIICNNKHGLAGVCIVKHVAYEFFSVATDAVNVATITITISPKGLN
jgi:hypothetical protein